MWSTFYIDRPQRRRRRHVQPSPSPDREDQGGRSMDRDDHDDGGFGGDDDSRAYEGLIHHVQHWNTWILR